MRAVEGLRPRAHAREASPEPDSAAAARAARRGLAAAALKSWWTERPSGEASGGELLSAVPELLELDQLDVVRLVAELALPTASPVISPRQRRRLIASIRRADRCADFGAGRAGAGLELALDIVLGDWQDIWVRGRGRSRPPLSLGAIAVCMHRESRRWRRGDRARRAARSC